ncbi:MAG: DUF4446 family protein [Solirubrobacteraceae bacterium]|nr:DUF4446 family protein [Patulibacter sp.]
MEQVDQIALGVGAAGLLFGVVAVGWATALQRRIGRIQRAQRVILGDHGDTDLILHAHQLTEQVQKMAAYLKATTDQTQQRLAVVEKRADGAISHSGLVRYDAYNEMSGRQSTSIALLDSRKTGVVLSSIHHRDQARMYAKGVREGVGELELSPEEAEALRVAMGA